MKNKPKRSQNSEEEKAYIYLASENDLKILFECENKEYLSASWLKAVGSIAVSLKRLCFPYVSDATGQTMISRNIFLFQRKKTKAEVSFERQDVWGGGGGDGETGHWGEAQAGPLSAGEDKDQHSVG